METTKKHALEEKNKYAEAAKPHKKVADDHKAAEKIFKKHAFHEDTRKPLRLPLCENLVGKSLTEEKVRDAVQTMLLSQACVLLRISDPRGPGINRTEEEEEEASENEAEHGGDVREEGAKDADKGKNGKRNSLNFLEYRKNPVYSNSTDLSKDLINFSNPGNRRGPVRPAVSMFLWGGGGCRVDARRGVSSL